MSFLFIAMSNQRKQLEAQKKSRRRIRRKRRIRLKSKVDQEQDLLLEELQQENEELQLCLGSLVQTLVKKGVLTEGEIEQIIESASEVENDE